MHVCQQCGAEVAQDDRFCAACGATLWVGDASAAKDPLIGRVVGGSYLLQEIVGVGGMGRVYRAEQSTLGRTIAVKVIHPHLLGDEQTVARFYQEARASSRLNHPNSVSIIDFGRTDDGILYLAMEFLTGRDLVMVMHEEGPLGLDRICRMMIATLDALGEAHERGVVHRDLKPENIILRRLRSGDDLVKVVDFGLATIVGGETSITKPGLVCGTPDYMPPEQGRGDPVDGRGDLYAAGVVIFELITGQLPYIDDTPTKVVLRHMNDVVPDPRDMSTSYPIPERLAELTMKALAKDPLDRFQSAKEMQDALHSVIAELNADRSVSQTCPACGASNPVTDKFCGSCGVRLSGEVSERPKSLRPSFYPPFGSQRHFLGRDSEMNHVLRLREQSEKGAVWVHLHGEIGVGKTRFLTEIAEHSAGLGDYVVGAGAHPTGAPVAYHPIRSLLSELFGCSPSELADVVAVQASTDNPMAAAGFAEVIDPKGLTGSDGQSRTGAVAVALAEAVKTAMQKAGAKRLLLMVDDLHCADGLTRQTLAELPRALGQVPVMVLTAGRQRREGAETVALVGFDLEQARAFVSANGQLELTKFLNTQSVHGAEQYLPLYLEQLEALGSVDKESMPLKLADAIAQRTERLSMEARHTLQAAATLGWNCEIGQLSELSSNEDLDSIEELVREALVQVTASGLSIVHPFIAEIVEAFIPAEARKELHREAMRMSVERNEPSAVQARHAFRGADPMTSLIVLERAGDTAMRYGDGEGGVMAYRRALELARRETLESGDAMMDTAIGTFSRKLGEAMARSGDPAGADGVLREVLDLTDPRSPDRARMLLSLGRVASRRDRPRDAMRHFGQALELVAGVDAGVESKLQVEIGRVRRVEGDPQHAANAFRRALELFDELKVEDVLRARIRLELAEVLLAAGETARAVEHLSEVEVNALDADALPLIARTVGTLGSVDEYCGKIEEARQRYTQAAELAAKSGDAPGYRRWLSAEKTLAP